MPVAAAVGFLEAFVTGALVGGAIGAVAFLALARSAKGRSTATAFLPERTAAQVLQIAHGYFARRGMAVQPIPGGISARAGSEWVTGARIVELRARERDGGTDVSVDAYLRGFYPKEVNLNPSSFFGMLPRRKALALAQGLFAALGAPGVPFQHRRAS